eukprot:1182540-Amphidinium_carterae.1
MFVRLLMLQQVREGVAQADCHAVQPMMVRCGRTSLERAEGLEGMEPRAHGLPVCPWWKKKRVQNTVTAMSTATTTHSAQPLGIFGVTGLLLAHVDACLRGAIQFWVGTNSRSLALATIHQERRRFVPNSTQLLKEAGCAVEDKVLFSQFCES